MRRPARVTVAALVLHGTADHFVRYAAMQRAVPAIRTVWIVTIDGGGHFPFRDDPERLTKEVAGFLAATTD